MALRGPGRDPVLVVDEEDMNESPPADSDLPPRKRRGTPSVSETPAAQNSVPGVDSLTGAYVQAGERLYLVQRPVTLIPWVPWVRFPYNPQKGGGSILTAAEGGEFFFW